MDTIETARSALAAAVTGVDAVSYSDISRRMGGRPSRQALKKFEEGEGGESFWRRLLRVLRGEPDVPDLVEEAEAALRLVREAEAAMLRVTERLRGADVSEDIAATIAAAVPPTPIAQPGGTRGKKRAGGSG